MLQEPNYQKLFSTPVMRFQVAGSDALNTDLIALCEQLKQEDEGAKKSNKGGWHSKGNIFENDNRSIQEIKSVAIDATNLITQKISPKLDLDTLKLKTFAWMNSSPSGAYNAPHTHPGAHWSGVYYVSQPEIENGSSGMIEFLDPRTDLPNWRILKSSAFKNKKSIRPFAGELIIFPSYLSHWVHPNETAQDRISIAFNSTFRKA